MSFGNQNMEGSTTSQIVYVDLYMLIALHLSQMSNVPTKPLHSDVLLRCMENPYKKRNLEISRMQGQLGRPSTQVNNEDRAQSDR